MLHVIANDPKFEFRYNYNGKLNFFILLQSKMRFHWNQLNRFYSAYYRRRVRTYKT